MKSLVSVLALAAFAATAAVAGPPSSPKPVAQKPAAPTAAVFMCPVNNEKVEDIKKAEKSTYKGKTYYFCCAGCKPAFDKNPEKYLKTAAAAPVKPAAKPAKKS